MGGPVSLVSPQGAHRRAAPARQGLWAVLADMLSYPTPGLAAAWCAGDLLEHLSELASGLPYELALDREALAGGADRSVLESEYIRLFDLPVSGPTVPLYGGAYGGGRHQVMEDLLRLYRHFGLSTAGAARADLPDALPTVLEFLSFLASLEAHASGPTAVGPVRDAQLDLLDHHLGRWCPAIVERLATRQPLAFYRATAELLARLVEAERTELGRTAAPGRPAPGKRTPVEFLAARRP